MGVSTELWHLLIGCCTMPRKCKIQLRTLKQVPINLVIRIVLVYLLVAETIESNPGLQTGSTRGNSSLRGSLRCHGRGCNVPGSGVEVDNILSMMLLWLHLYTIPLV